MSNEPSDQYDDVHRMAADRLVEDINGRLVERGPIAVESIYEKNIREMTDAELAVQALDLKAKVDVHMKEMARRLFKNAQLGESG